MLRHCLLALTCLILAPGSPAAQTQTQADQRLLEAVKAGDAPVVTALLDQSADVNLTEPDGMTALHWAAHFDNLAIARRLLQAGADVGASSRYGVAPLLLAATNASVSMIRLLLDAGADPNTATPEGETALMTVARAGRVAGIDLLVSSGADVDAAEGWRGQTALMWAAAEGLAPAARALIEAGADVHARSNGGFTPLLFASREGQVAALGVLVDAGADPDDTLPAIASRRTGVGTGMSALVLAVYNAHYDIAAALLDAGADANAGEQGWTALHQVVWTRRPNLGRNPPFPVPSGVLNAQALVRRLIEHGADPNSRQTAEPRDGNRNVLNRIGATPFLLAAKAADVEMMRLLADLGARPEPDDRGGRDTRNGGGPALVSGRSAKTQVATKKRSRRFASRGSWVTRSTQPTRTVTRRSMVRSIVAPTTSCAFCPKRVRTSMRRTTSGGAPCPSRRVSFTPTPSIVIPLSSTC